MAFYEDGLKFSCKRCGDCCRGINAYVWLYRGDIEAMAELLSMSVADFKAKYTEVFEKSMVLKSFPNGDCIFYNEDSGCKIHKARPIQCRAFPFWAEYLRNPRSWALVAKHCPGVDSGELHSKEEIEDYLKKMGSY
ncbi:YkgJ family cysteine cluster protein [bacterium]|nr:YkgJ family cysteine cluster protein [bacterium]